MGTVTLEELCRRYIEKPTCARYDVLADKVVKLSEGKIAHVVHGHWKYVEDDVYTCYKCSACGSTLAGDKSRYCPGCGAKMDEEEEK